MIKEEYIKNRLQYTKDLLKYYVSTVLDEDLSYTQTEFVVDQIGTLKMQIAEFENELAEQAWSIY